MGCDRKLSVKYKESLYFCSNKGIWKCRSYNGAEEALFQPQESVSMPLYQNTMTTRKIWWLLNSRTPTLLFLFKLTQISGSWHCTGFLGSLQLHSFPEVAFLKKTQAPSPCPQRSMKKVPATEGRQGQAGRCLQWVGAVMDWSHAEVAKMTSKQVQRCSRIAIEKVLVCLHWTWNRFTGI